MPHCLDSMIRTCSRLCLQTTSLSKHISTSSTRHSIDEFFPQHILKDQRDRSIVDNSEDVPKDSNLSGDSDQDIDFGRSWEVSDLQALKSPVLQALWFVLLKERNKCLTMDAFYRQYRKSTSLYLERLKSVQESMENLQSVIEERELNIDIAKTHLWMKRVSNLLGDDFAKELAATYVKYTIPHTEKDKEGMKKLKHHQLFTPEFNRIRQPYEQWDIEYNFPKRRDKLTVWEEKMRNYESENYVHEDDWEPGLEGFLHNIKRDDWEELEADPEDMTESRERREEDRLKIIARIWNKREETDRQLEIDQLMKWKHRVQGDGSPESGPD